MINYPVHYDEELGGIYDKSCHFICDVSSKTHGNEIVKRINMYDELVGCLMLARDMFIANDLILPKTLETINDSLEKCK